MRRRARAHGSVGACFALAFALTLGVETGPVAAQEELRRTGPSPGFPPLVDALRTELLRSRRLRMEGAATPHYIAYGVLEMELTDVVAEFGGLVQDDRSRRRYLRVDLRTGTPAFDSGNTRDQGFWVTQLPLDDDPIALRRAAWWTIDRAFKGATEALEKKRAEELAASDERIPDFSVEPVASTFVRDEVESPDADRLRDLAVRLSGLLRNEKHVYEGGVRIRAVKLDRYFVSDEGYGFEPGVFIQWAVIARTQAADGMNLMHHDSLIVRSEKALPSEAELAERVKRVARELAELRQAPAAEAWVGPVLFEGQAAGALLRSLLVPHLLGTPPPSGDDGVRTAQADPSEAGSRSTFTRRVGKRVAPSWLSAYDEPRLEASEEPLVGSYAFDDEGIPAQRVELIDKGRLLGFLMSRTPAKEFPRSNGHGRGALISPRAQIGNLFVTSTRTLPASELRTRALEEARAAGEPHALVVRRIEDPSITSAYWGADFQRNAASLGGMLYAVRLLPDGSEQPVRGLSLVSLDPRALKDLQVSGARPTRYDFFAPTYPGGQTYWSSFPAYAVGASITTPSLLFEEMELAPTPKLRTATPIIRTPAVDTP